jgi:nucleoside-diphosphate-sugar epimerase
MTFEHKTVLITGATGFFGSWMSKLIEGNLVLANHDNLSDTLKEMKYDYIFHFAPTPIEPIIECAKRSDAKVLYASSGAIYGGIEKKVSEDDPADPKTYYGMNKLHNELVLKRSGLDYCIARLFTFCGKGMNGTFAITSFVDALKQGKPLPVLGGGKSVRTYLHIEDAARWLYTIMLNGYGVYNVGSHREITIEKLAKQVSTFRIPPAELFYDKREFVDPAPYYVPDCTRARDLDLCQVHSLEYGIRSML